MSLDWPFNVKFKRLIVVLVILVVSVFFAERLVSLWSSIPFASLSPDLVLLSLSLLVLLIGFFVMGVGWWFALLGVGERSSFILAFSSFAVTQLGKYLPGSVWSFVGRAVILKGNKSAAFLASGVEMLFKLVAALLLALLIVDTDKYIPAWLVGVALALSLLLTSPAIIHPVLRKLNRFTGKVEVPIDIIRQRWLLSSMVVNLLTWGLVGLAYGLFVNAFVPASVVPLIGAFSLAWAVGFIVIPVPAGIGVREAVLVFFTAPMVGEPLALILALVARVWWMLGDLLLFGVGVLTRNILSSRNPQ